MENIAHRSLLFDFYGPMLTSKQQEIFDLYYQQDLSLGEIAEIQAVSRQAIFDLLKRTEESLNNYEQKLGLVGKYEKALNMIAEIQIEINGIQVQYPQLKTNSLQKLLDKLKDNW